MFETLDTAEITLPGMLAAPGIRVWAYAGHGLHLPWFHVAVSVRGAGKRHNQVVFASALEQVLQLASASRPARQIAVKLVSPPYMNGTEHWKMERLLEVWKGTESDQVVYVVEGTRRYTDAGLLADSLSLKELDRVF